MCLMKGTSQRTQAVCFGNLPLRRPSSGIEQPQRFIVLSSLATPAHPASMCPDVSGVAVPGMSAGVPKYVTINLGQLAERFSGGEEVSLATLQAKRVLNLSGKEAKLPLKVGCSGLLGPAVPNPSVH